MSENAPKNTLVEKLINLLERELPKYTHGNHQELLLDFSHLLLVNYRLSKAEFTSLMAEVRTYCAIFQNALSVSGFASEEINLENKRKVEERLDSLRLSLEKYIK